MASSSCSVASGSVLYLLSSNASIGSPACATRRSTPMSSSTISIITMSKPMLCWMLKAIASSTDRDRHWSGASAPTRKSGSTARRGGADNRCVPDFRGSGGCCRSSARLSPPASSGRWRRARRTRTVRCDIGGSPRSGDLRRRWRRRPPTAPLRGGVQRRLLLVILDHHRLDPLLDRLTLDVRQRLRLAFAEALLDARLVAASAVSEMWSITTVLPSASVARTAS